MPAIPWLVTSMRWAWSVMKPSPGITAFPHSNMAALPPPFCMSDRRHSAGCDLTSIPA